jgi:sarcosine oxidase
MSSNHYDVIVTGVGTMGASACWYLAKRNLKVLGLEQFDIPHEQGAHAGQSRIIRKAYYEHSNYVALLDRAYHNWKEIEQQTSSKLYYKTGLLYFGDPASVLIKGTRETAEQYNLPLDVLSAKDASERFPQVKFNDHYQVLFEPDAGFITPEKSVATYVTDAISRGADIRGREKVIDWNYNGSHVTVKTDKGLYSASKLVISAGAWTKNIVPKIPAELTVTRQLIAWMNPADWSSFTLNNFPCWFTNDDDGNLFYGFPILPPNEFSGPVGLKLAHHKPGNKVDPDNVDRNIQPGEEVLLKNILERHFPGASGHVLTLKTCLYTNSTDANFIIDHVPGTDSHVAIATGFSGHGFKFSSVVGEILSDLIIDGKTNLPIDFLKLERFYK